MYRSAGEKGMLLLTHVHGACIYFDGLPNFCSPTSARHVCALVVFHARVLPRLFGNVVIFAVESQ